MRRRSVCTNPSACSHVSVVEAVALDDERIAVPTADGVALPDRQRIRLERSAVREDLTIGRVRVEHRDHAWTLHDPSHATAAATRTRDVARPLRQAPHVRAISVVVALVLGHRSARPRLDLRLVAQVAAHSSAAPQTGQLGAAIGGARRGRGEIRFAVGRARDTRCSERQPLCRHRCGRHC